MHSTLPRLRTLHHSEDISIEDMLRFEQSCLRLDVRQCDTSRPDDKTRILRAVRGEGGKRSDPVPASIKGLTCSLLPHIITPPTTSARTHSLTLIPCIDQGQRGRQAHDQGGLGDAGPLLQVR